MDWISVFILAITNMSPIEAMLITIIVGTLILKGIIKIPLFIKRKKKNENLLEILKSSKDYPSILQVIDHAMAVSDEIVRIKYIDTIYDQMNLAEESWRRIKLFLKTYFLKDEVNYKNYNIDKHDIKEYYNLVIYKLEKEMIGIIRQWMKRNHFINKSEVEYQEYIEEKIKDFKITLISILGDIGGMERFDLKDISLDIAKELTVFLMKARVTGRKSQTLIDKLKKQLPKINIQEKN